MCQGAALKNQTHVSNSDGSSSDNMNEQSSTISKKSSSRHRSVSPITYSNSDITLRKSGSKSPAGYGGVSSTDGELSDSDDELPPMVQSTIVPVSSSSTALKANSLEPPSPNTSGSNSHSPRAKRRKSGSASRDEGEIPDWKRDRSYTPEEERKSRQWKEVPTDSKSRRSNRDRDEAKERRDKRRMEDRRQRFNDDRERDFRHREEYSRGDDERRERGRDREDYYRDDRYRRRRDDRDRDRRRHRDHTPEGKSKENGSKDAEKENIQQEPVKPVAAKKNKEDTFATRTGGAYIPPARLRLMQAAITDKSSAEYQRMSWEALKKSINGLVNKINVSNIKEIIVEILGENVIRGRGLLCRSILQAQAASPTFTHVYAALVAIVNSKFPQIGELLLKRVILQFRRGFRRNDKSICLSATQFLAHLVNQQVAHEIIALEVLTLLLERASDDSVEISVGFLKECGQKLTEISPRGINAIFERMRNILHEAKVDLRVQYMIEVMFSVRKDKFKDHLAIAEGLELVEEDDQFTHLMSLDEVTDGEDMLNVFKEDPEFLANEEKYKELKNEILDESDSDESGSGGSKSGSGSDNESSEDEAAEEAKQKIIDQTETNLVGLRRTIYLTLQSSLDYEEAAHKLLKIQLKPGQEVELCNMILDCGAQQRTYEKFYGLLAQRFCMLDRKYVEHFEMMFMLQYESCHRLDPTKLRNVSKFFGHLLHTDAISWGVLQAIKMNEDDTTSSSRIFVKQLFLELAEYMGLPKLNDRLKDETLQGYFEGVLPKDHPKKTRFAINFFTSIGLGGLTDGLREHLKNMPKPSVVNPMSSSSSSDSSSSSSSSSSDSSDSEQSSGSDRRRRRRK